MRLHHLTVTAFGPFAETVSVDFDQLSEAGLFLLSGPTGAGKTSVLDAVCFALFGDVPGDRSGAKRLRCDTAAPGVAPKVRLEVTLSGRRFRLERSPAWVRPKRRGAGDTTEPAHVVIEESIQGEWAPLSSRLDETGHLVTELVGMNMTQFCQVALLPQGSFQAFLRARSEDRHKLLQQLFSTQRFEDVEQWLRERARDLLRQVNGHQHAVGAVLNRILEATDSSLPEAWADDDLGALLDDGLLEAWVADLASSRADGLEQAETALTSSVDARQTARTARETGHRLADLQSRGARSAQALLHLEEEQGAQEARLARLERGRRAAPLGPLHRHASTTARDRDLALETAAAQAHSAARSAAQLDLHPAASDATTDRKALQRIAEESRRHAAVAAALAPREPELALLREAIASDNTRQDTLSRRREELLAEEALLPARLEVLALHLDEARDAASRVKTLEAEQSTLRLLGEASERLACARNDLARLREEQTDVVTECLRLKEEWLTVREDRISGMAAELANALVVGGCCPVCGSEEHPHKAQAGPDAPSAQSEKEARRRLDDAELARVAVDDRVRELSLTVATLEGQVGQAQPADQREKEACVARDLADTARTAGRLDPLEAELERTQQAREAIRSELSELEVDLVALETRLTEARDRAERVTAELTGARRGHGDLASLVSAMEKLADTCEAAQRQAERADGAERAAARAREAVDEWLADSPFTSLHDALDALLPPDEHDALAVEIARHDEAVHQARAVLDDPEVARAMERPSPDLDTLDLEAQRCEDAVGAAEGTARAARRTLQRLRALEVELNAALALWRPARDAHATAGELAAFVQGTSSDNELRMRLSAYVLAWRLSQVVAAANERLVRMSDERYSLEQTAHRGAGETRGGLSLLVRDEWSGESRDPATLSGGETFVVSLALALGLADVVTREAGGADLDTLFVDEGFGSLDADTLDDVMDTLDTLREGGRVVGVVSHVGEMRSRIPTRLAVSKGRTGSTVAIVRDVS